MRTKTILDPTRSAAFDLLTAVLEKHRSLDDALDALPSMAPRDRAAGHRLAASVLRRSGSLDLVLEPFLRREPPLPARILLRMGAAQALLLDTPAHAAVSTVVDLARARGLAPFAGLLNAVLRRVAEGGPALLEAIDGPRADTPAWLWTSWGRRARAIALAHQDEAPLDLSLRPGAATPEGATLLPTGTARLPAGTRVAELAGFEAGEFWVQDAAAALPARLLGVRPGERVADLCAAPGGKTAQLALAGASVVAVERDASRAGRLAENLTRLRASAEIVIADAAEWAPAERFDAILLDAPCTATGTIRRHPEILHLRRPRDVATLAAQQARLLGAAAGLLRPGGRLVFATCSLQPEEGEAHGTPAGLRDDPIRPEELPGLAEAITPTGRLRTDPGMWPDQGGMDGFFAARFVREA
jgi:16S rRNA (cytosine967-C5)-methyltransferase